MHERRHGPSWGSVLLAVVFALCGGLPAAFAQDAHDLNTELPPPPPPTPASPTFQSDVDNGDGTWTFTQTINGASTPPHYAVPGHGGGFDIYSWYYQDYGWQHDFPHWSDPNLQVLEARLTIVAWDIDSEPEWGYDGEYDGVHVDGTLLDPGYLQGNNQTWSTTVFDVQRSAIVDDGLVNVWLDIDMHHNQDTWATTLDHCELQITYAIGDPNNQPYEPELVIYPECPGNDDALVVTVTGPDPADPNGDEVSYEYRWFVDVGTGQYIDDEFAGRGDHTGNVVPGSDTVEGDMWRVQVLPVDDTGQRGDFATESWPRAIGCSSGQMEILDANPRYLSDQRIDEFPVDFDAIRTGGKPVSDVTTDGASLLLIRLTANTPGGVTVRLGDSIYPGDNRGSLQVLGGAPSGYEAVGGTVPLGGDHVAFFIYTPPEALLDPIDPTPLIESREIIFTATFTPDSGVMSTEEHQVVTLRRPPVLLVHGIWPADNLAWPDNPGWGQLESAWGFPVDTADYSETSHHSFDFNYNELVRRCRLMLQDYRDSSVACTQINVVAHSMGGLLARRWANDPSYLDDANFEKGWVNLLVTVDSPHHGSPLANHLIEMSTGSAWAQRCFEGITEELEFGPGVIDLAVGSTAIQSFGPTPIPVHAIYGEGGTDDWDDAAGGERELGDNWNQTRCFPYLSTDVLGDDPHDYIVPSPSQQAGLSAQYTTSQVGPAGQHMSAVRQLSTASIATRLLIHGAVGLDISTAGLPAPPTVPALVASVGSQFATPVVVAPSASEYPQCVDLVSPVDGQVVRPGEVLEIQADFSGLDVVSAVFRWSGTWPGDIDAATGHGSIEVLDWDCGERTGYVLADLADGSTCISATVRLQVVPDAQIDYLSLTSRSLLLAGPGATGQLYVGGQFNDGIFRGANSQAVGTTYEVADPLIATVGPSGEVLALRPGTTAVEIRNGNAVISAEVKVLYAVSNAVPIVELPADIETCLGQTLCLEAAGTYDPDARPGEILAYSWDLDGDGTYHDAYGPEPCVVVMEPGVWDIGLEVRDISGGVSRASAQLVATFCGAIIDGSLPERPLPGSPVQVIGRLFGPDPGEGNRSTDTHHVLFDGVRIPDADILSWDDTSIQFRLPGNAFTGLLSVTVDGQSSNEHLLEVAIPVGGCVFEPVADPAVTPLGKGMGAAFADFDGDGVEDLIGTGDATWVATGVGDGTFDAPRNLEVPGEGRAAIWFDKDNDGDLDLLVVTYDAANVLFENSNGLAPALPGAEAEVGKGYNASVADVDLDGDLDLFVANDGGGAPLLLNEAGVFTRSSLLPEVTGRARGCGFADYDLDGDPDLYVSLADGPNLLYRNDGPAGFVAITGSPVNDDGHGKGVAWGDYDDDGDPDLYITNTTTPNRLFRNDGQDLFTDVTDSVTGDEGMARSCAWLDFDLDGRLDLFVANALGPSRLLRNLGDGLFEDANCGPLDELGPTWGCAVGDPDDDGDPDIYLTQFQAEDANVLLRNRMYGGSWIKLDLRGGASNTFGIGARVLIHTGDATLTRTVDAGSGYLTTASPTLSVGLGEASRVDLEVFWPSGVRQVVTGVDAGSRLELVEATGLSGTRVSDLPETFGVRAYPNPFNPATKICFDLPADAKVSVRVYDVSGRLVRTVVANQPYRRGSYAESWNGRDDRGRGVSSGVYFYRVTAGAHVGVGRAVLLK